MQRWSLNNIKSSSWGRNGYIQERRWKTIQKYNSMNIPKVIRQCDDQVSQEWDHPPAEKGPFVYSHDLLLFLLQICCKPAFWTRKWTLPVSELPLNGWVFWIVHFHRSYKCTAHFSCTMSLSGNNISSVLLFQPLYDFFSFFYFCTFF